MKTKITSTIALVLLCSLLAFSFSNGERKKGTTTKKPTTVAEPTNIGVEKGKRKYCGGIEKKTCCGKSFCVVTPKVDDEGDVAALNYLEGTLSKVDDKFLAIDIPYNKILPGVYADWFKDDIYEGEYFPLSNSVASLVDLNNIALTAGNYPVVTTSGGFRIVIRYEVQTGE